jgi:hypothetical protein
MKVVGCGIGRRKAARMIISKNSAYGGSFAIISQTQE